MKMKSEERKWEPCATMCRDRASGSPAAHRVSITVHSSPIYWLSTVWDYLYCSGHNTGTTLQIVTAPLLEVLAFARRVNYRRL